MLREARCFALVFSLCALFFLPAVAASSEGDEYLSVDWSFMPPKGYPGGEITTTISLVNKGDTRMGVSRLFFEFDWNTYGTLHYGNSTSQDIVLEAGQSKDITIKFTIDSAITAGTYVYRIYVTYNYNTSVGNAGWVLRPIVSGDHDFGVVATSGEAYGGLGNNATLWMTVVGGALVLGIAAAVGYLVWKRSKRKGK
jgi:hypothetical protein